MNDMRAPAAPIAGDGLPGRTGRPHPCTSAWGLSGGACTDNKCVSAGTTAVLGDGRVRPRSTYTETSNINRP